MEIFIKTKLKVFKNFLMIIDFKNDFLVFLLVLYRFLFTNVIARFFSDFPTISPSVVTLGRRRRADRDLCQDFG